MTLMELVVGILMFTIISITVSMLLAPILMSYTRANDFAEYNALLDNIANQLINDISQSTEPPDFDPGEWTNNAPVPAPAPVPTPFLTIFTHNRIIRYSAQGGILLREGIDDAGNRIWFPVFSDDFYKRKLVSFMITDESDDDITAYTLTVELTENRGDAAPFIIDRTYAVRPLMLNQGDLD
jgi:hypothetical protein